MLEPVHQNPCCGLIEINEVFETVLMTGLTQPQMPHKCVGAKKKLFQGEKYEVSQTVKGSNQAKSFLKCVYHRIKHNIRLKAPCCSHP